VVFSDVDTLAGSTASLPTEALSLLREVALRRLPLVLSSTRSRAELDVIQQELGIHAPFIFESGAAVSVPPGYFRGPVQGAHAVGDRLVVPFGRPCREVIAELRQASAQLAIELVGLSDLSIEQTALAWGVTPLEASRVKMREYGEPFRILRGMSRRDTLFRALRARGFLCATGGRYDYVGAVGETAGMAFLLGLYRETFGSVVTIGIGTRHRDAELLAQVDVPIVVPAEPDPPHIMKLRSPRSSQWLATLLGPGRARCAQPEGV
jgi:mannosyl-3-phosphoglycerate phosphatase